MTTRPSSELRNLMGAYFHEDFDETGGVWGTLDLYLDEANDTRISVLVGEIDATLAAAHEREVESLLDSLGCAVLCDGGESPYRTWLHEIRVRARDRLAGARAT